MKYLFLLFLAACSAVKDPKVYEDVIELTEEIVKDEFTTTNVPCPNSQKLPLYCSF